MLLNFFLKLSPLSSLNTDILTAIYYETKAPIEQNNSSMNIHIENKSRFVRTFRFHKALPV